MFAFRLAADLGIADVFGMLRDMSSVQLQWWMAFRQIEPFESRRADLRAGAIVSTITNMIRAACGDERRMTISDATLDFSPGEKTPVAVAKPEQQDWQTHKRVAQMWNEAMGGTYRSGG